MNTIFIERVRAKLWSTAVGPAIVIWFFGYVLVDTAKRWAKIFLSAVERRRTSFMADGPLANDT